MRRANEKNRRNLSELQYHRTKKFVDCYCNKDGTLQAEWAGQITRIS